jgi:putative phage-type endonuclease
MPNFPQFDSAEVVAEQGSLAWYSARENSVGGSEAAAVCGLSEYDTPLSIYRRKLGLDPEPDESDAMLMGKFFEPAILRMFRAKTGTKVYTRKPPSYRSKKWPWMTVSPDGLCITEPHGLEAKRTNQFMTDQWGKPGTDDIPASYNLQCQQAMGVILELQVVWVPVIIGASFRIYRVPRNDRLIGQMAEIEKEFVRKLADQQPPEPTWDHSTTLATIKGMFGITSGKAVDLSDESKLLKAEYEALGQSIKADEARKAAIKAKWLYEMGDSQYGLLGDGSAFRRQEQSIAEHTVSGFTKTDTRIVKAPAALALTVK